MDTAYQGGGKASGVFWFLVLGNLGARSLRGIYWVDPITPRSGLHGGVVDLGYLVLVLSNRDAWLFFTSKNCQQSPSESFYVMFVWISRCVGCEMWVLRLSGLLMCWFCLAGEPDTSAMCTRDEAGMAGEWKIGWIWEGRLVV